MPDHHHAPVLDALENYHRRDRYGFTPPGHRGARGVDDRTLEVLGEAVFRNDVLATSGLDDRASRGGVVGSAEDLMADAVGADHAFFSTCGSSLSVKAAVLAVAGRHGGILVGRDVHKSVASGLVLSGLRPRWVQPQWDAERHLAHPPSPADVDGACARGGVGAVLVTSPSPYGTCADLRELVRVCHSHDLPLVVDEAWGAHLPFHEDLPTWAMDAGADLCVTSLHKSGGGLEQSSVFHVQGDRIDLAHLAQCADMLATTSPNVLLYAAMDGWRRHMVEHGHELLEAALRRADQVRGELDDLPGVRVMQEELLGEQASCDLDRLQVLLDIDALGTTGYAMADALREHHAIDAHVSDHRRLCFQISYADTDRELDRLVAAISDLVAHADRLPTAPRIVLPDPTDLELDQVMTPRDAFFARCEDVPVESAAGRIAAEQVTPYPPGVPVALPGERLSLAVLEYLSTGVAAGMQLPDAADPRMRTIRVVAA